jgi:tetratricopeptide (TPR) repeat protein
MSGDQKAFQYAMNQGHSAAWDLEWERASSFYRVALAEFPENASALTSLALALFELQKYSEALEYYQRAAKVAPNDPMPMQKVAELHERLGNLKNATIAYMNVADLYARNKEVEKAIQNWIRVTALDPQYLAAHTRLALVYERLGRTTEAMVEYISIASLLQIQGNIQTAIQTVRHALDVVPNSKEANLALTLLQSGKPLPTPSRPRIATGPGSMAQFHPGETSKTEAETRSRLDPVQDARQKALAMLAEILFEQEDAQAPEPHKGLANIVKGMIGEDHYQYDQSKIILHLSQAIDLQSHGQEKEAAMELELAMEAGLESSAASYVLGFMQSKSDQLESAVSNLKKAVQHELFSLGARLLLALTLYKKEEIKESSVEYLEALRIADSQSVSADQAEELSALYEPLIESFRQESDGKLQKRICENISKMLIRPDWREQIQIARQQLPEQPSGSTPVPLAEMLTEATSSQLVESLAKVNQLARSNKLSSAMEEAFYALKFAPTYLPLHICIGDLLVQEGRVPDAVLKYTIVAKSYSVRGESNQAINLLKRVTELNPIDMEARKNLIDLLITRGKVQDTIQEYTKLAESYYHLADFPMARKTYSVAFRYAQQSNVDRDNKVKIMERMADIDMQSLDWHNAIRIFEQIRNLDPDDEKARNSLFDLNLRLGQATQAMTELDNYLNHLITSHRTTEALEYINTKIHENQSQPTLYRRLAEIYRLLGRNEEAINQLEMAKELFIQAENRPAAIEALRTILALKPSNASMYQRMLVELEAEAAGGK